MVRHVILWSLKESLTEAEKIKIKQDMKINLESLVGLVPGLLSVCVVTEGLASSNVDVMLDCTLESEEALRQYAIHPAHVKVADTYVRPYTAVRNCMDYKVS